MRYHLHILLHKTEENAIHPINFCASIRQDNNTLGAEKYCIKIIISIISYFICTTFWKYFLYYGFNTLSSSILTWTPYISSMINARRCNYLPGAEAREVLGTILSGLCATLYLHIAQPLPKPLQFLYRIILSPSSAPPLLSLSL